MLCKLGYALEFHWVGKTSPNQSAVYKINCSDCHASHIGETGRNLTTRLTEHKQSQIVTTTDTSLSQDFTHPDNHTTLLHVTPRFKPSTMCNKSINKNKVSFFKYNIHVSETIHAQHQHHPLKVVLTISQCSLYFFILVDFPVK